MTRRKAYFSGSIRRYIVIWVGIIVLACIILAVSLFSITAKLESCTISLIDDFRAKEVALSLKNLVQTEQKADLMWRLTRNDSMRDERLRDLHEARAMLPILSATVSSKEEAFLVGKVKEKFQDFYALESMQTAAPFAESTLRTEALLRAIQDIWEVNDRQATATVASSDKLLAIMHRWLLVLALGVAAVVTAGASALTRRIVRPTLDLSDTASRVGQGDITARVPILHDDEMGMLGRTFNSMAEDIARREKTRHEFIAAVIHDIRNPLVNIGAIVRLLRRKQLPPEQTNIWLDRMMGDVDRLDDLVQDLMDTVQVESGRLSLQKAEIDLGALAESIHREQAEIITTHRLEFRGNESCHILGDRRRLERVIINLLSNAMKYSPEGTSVVMQVENRNSQAVFSITDQGVGISPEDMKVLFQPFGRLVRTRDMAHGTGLGLYIVKKIIEAHSGSIQISSELGIGTTLEISLPLI